MSDNPHIGHRQRMRRKLFEYSRRVFDTYELLEMLLYYSVRLRDTNPISKSLLQGLSSLNGVLHADFDKLTEIEGVGEKSAKLIVGVNRLHKALFLSGSAGEDTARLCFCDLLSLIGADAEIGSKLLCEYSIRNIFEADADSLKDITGEKIACFILLVSALLSRRITDNYAKQKRLTEKDTENYLIGLFFGLPYENIYMLSYGSQGELIASDFITEGVLDGSEILPKKILSLAKKRGAVGISLAHNHPMASPEPSPDDIESTAILAKILTENGIALCEHYIVAQGRVNKIPR